MPRSNSVPAPSFGQRLRQRRWQELRVFQATVAQAAGISPAQLCELERGTAGTTPSTLQRLAAVLGLDYAPLAAQATAEGRLTPRPPRPEPARPPDLTPASLPAHPPRPRPPAPNPWLTAQEAAALLGCRADTVRRLIRRGRLAPAVLVPKSAQGQRHWLVAAAAVEAYEPPNAGRQWPQHPDPAPPGYLSLTAFAEAVGLPYATMHRRLGEWQLVTRRSGHRRWVRADQVDLVRQRQAMGAEP